VDEMIKVKLRRDTNWLLALAAAVVVVGAAGQVAAQSANLEGAWNGGGSVQFSSGKSERARCRASFSKSGANSYEMSAVCASASGRASQTAQLTRTGANRYAGSFRNSEYGVTGSISVSVNGNSLNASLNGGGGSASLNLNR
jgi:hypothetical protein